MPQNKEGKKKAKKKRQPSFTLPKNPYRHHYGTGSPPVSRAKGPMVGTWTLLRSSSKQGQGRPDNKVEGARKNGFVKLNDKISQNLDVGEIGSWMRKQKELYARHKRPPAVPKRSPETKLSLEIQPHELAEIDGALPPLDYDDDEQAPESGYITPEQQGSELEYPLLSQARATHQGAYGSPHGSVSSGQSPQHVSNSQYTTHVQAEVHFDSQGLERVNTIQNNRGSVASLGSMPMLPPPPPPDGAMALQMNPLHRASGKPLSIASASTLLSSGSSSGTSGTLHDPYQTEDLYEHFIPHNEVVQNTLARRDSVDGAMFAGHESYSGYNYESNLYERTLPTPGNNQNVPNMDGLQNRPLPAPPGGHGQNHTMNFPGRNSMPNIGNMAMTMPSQNRMSSIPQMESFPPPPPQFADNQNSQSQASPIKQTQPRVLPKPSSPKHEQYNDASPTKNSLPFPVKLRSIGSPLLRRANEQTSPQHQDMNIYKGNILNTVVPPPSQKSKGTPPPVKPKTGAADIPPPPIVSPTSASHPVSPFFPPPPPLLATEPEYADISDHMMPPPPPILPPAGMSSDLASRVQQWAISNDERTLRPSSTTQSPDGHSALINQIQTGIKLRKSPFSNRLFDQQKEESSPLQNNQIASPSTDYTYGDSIETCSIISGGSSSSGCHSNSSYSNSTTGSLPPQTLPKPKPEGKKRIDTNTMPGNASNARGINTQRGPIHIDVTQLPGYQPIPPNCPSWKISMIEKKNQQLETEAKRKISAQIEEEDRWKDIPEWKRSLIIEKEKRKQDDEAPLEAERRKRDEELSRLHSLPDWKRDLILKKRGDL